MRSIDGSMHRHQSSGYASSTRCEPRSALRTTPCTLSSKPHAASHAQPHATACAIVLQASRCEPRSATRYRLCHCPPKPHAASHAQPHATAWSCPASHSNLKKPTCAQRQRREHTNTDKSSRMTSLTTTPRWGTHAYRRGLFRGRRERGDAHGCPTAARTFSSTRSER